uniref:Uncharacterized protein n=1 Tax=Varanus komodoensis TaxID=61221 RepID=A0A8D2JKZ8_VARKO
MRFPTLLLLGTAALLAAPSSALPPPKERAPKTASWDEMNLLAHGMLQLGHGLKDHVDSTRSQLRQLAELLGAHNASISSLERSAVEQRRQFSRAQRLLDGRVAELDSRVRMLAARLAGCERLDSADNTSSSDRAPELGALQVRPGGQRGGGAE